MKFTAKLSDRDFDKITALPEHELKPLRWGWNAMGGPEYAIVEFRGSINLVQDVLHWLRYGIEIFSPFGQRVWWGMIYSVQLDIDGLTISRSLDRMANSIAVETGEGFVEGDFLKDTASVNKYGEKQRLLSSQIASSINLTQRKQIELNYSKEPHYIQDVRQNTEVKAILECSGWMKTLEWKYFFRDEGLLEYLPSSSDMRELSWGVIGDTIGIVSSGNTSGAPKSSAYDSQQRMNLMPSRERVYISGSNATNNGLKTIQSVSDENVYTKYLNSTTFYSNTIEENGQPFTDCRVGDIIRVQNSLTNDGYHVVYGIGGVHYTAIFGESIQVLPGGFNTEGPLGSVVITKCNYLTFEENMADDLPTSGVNINLEVGPKGVLQQFLVGNRSWDVRDIGVMLSKEGDPAGNLLIQIWSDTSDVPITKLTESVLTPADVSKNRTWTEVTLSSDLTLAANTKYWLRVVSANAIIPTDYYKVGIDLDANYTDGLFREQMNDGTLVAADPAASLIFQLTGYESTTEQISFIIDDNADFLTEARIIDNSGVETVPYREGLYSAYEAVMELLELGTSNGQRLLAKVTPERKLEIYEEPELTEPEYYREPSGTITTENGTPLPPGELPIGWMKIKGALPAVNTEVAAATLFIERSEFDAENNQVTLHPRGAKLPWKLFVNLEEG